MVLAYCFSTHRGWIWEKMAVHSTLGSLASRDLSAHIQFSSLSRVHLSPEFPET